MRKVLRGRDNKSYWDERWSKFEEDQDEFENLEIYPIKYAGKVARKNALMLEAGCGLGRVLKHYHFKGYRIVGMELSMIALKKLKKHQSLKLVNADIKRLPFQDSTFDSVMAFGLYHNIEHGIDQAIRETYRCIKDDGCLCASVRCDNIENRLIDFLSGSKKSEKAFHKWCFTPVEFTGMLEKEGFTIKSVDLVSNVPFLFKFRLFRKAKSFSESKARSEGFQLSSTGRLIHKLLKRISPSSFCNTIVVTAQKNARR